MHVGGDGAEEKVCELSNAVSSCDIRRFWCHVSPRVALEEQVTFADDPYRNGENLEHEHVPAAAPDEDGDDNREVPQDGGEKSGLRAV